MFGYIEFYFKVENETQVAYCKYDSDFSKPITEIGFENLKQSFKDMYEASGFKVDSITPCTREEYLNDKSKELTSTHWNEED